MEIRSSENDKIIRLLKFFEVNIIFFVFIYFMSVISISGDTSHVLIEFPV